MAGSRTSIPWETIVIVVPPTTSLARLLADAASRELAPLLPLAAADGDHTVEVPTLPSPVRN